MTSKLARSASPAQQESKSAPSLPIAALGSARRFAVSPAREEARALRVASRSGQRESVTSPKQNGNENANGLNQQRRSSRSNASPNAASSRDGLRKLAGRSSPVSSHRGGSSPATASRATRAGTAEVDLEKVPQSRSMLNIDKVGLQVDLVSGNSGEVDKAEHSRSPSTNAPLLIGEFADLPLRDISAKLDRLTLFSSRAGSTGAHQDSASVTPAGLGRAMRNMSSLSTQVPAVTRDHAYSSSSTVRGSSPASRSTSPYRKDSLSGGKLGGFQEPLGVSIELGMELVRRNRQLEREVRRLTDGHSRGSSLEVGAGKQASSSSSVPFTHQTELEELTQDLANVCRWAEEAERLQRHACRTILHAVRKESPEGRDVHQALAQLAAFPPPPMRHSLGGSEITKALAEELTHQLGNEHCFRSSDREGTQNGLVSNDEMLDLDAAQLRSEVMRLGDELSRLRNERSHAIQERRKTFERMESMQKRVEATEGIAKELVMKLASICQLCDGVPVALAQQQAAAIAALNSLSAPGAILPVAPMSGRSLSTPPANLPHPSMPSRSLSPQQLEEETSSRRYLNAPKVPTEAMVDVTPREAEAYHSRSQIPTHERPLSQRQEIRSTPPQRLRSLERRPIDGEASSAPPESQFGNIRTQTPPSRLHSHRSPLWPPPVGQGTPPFPDPAPTALQEAIFNVLDTNKDGIITREELSQALRAGIIQEGNFTETMLDASMKAPRPIMVSSVSNLLAPNGSPMHPFRSVDSPMTSSPLGSPLTSPISYSRGLLSNAAPVMPVTVSTVIHSPIMTPKASVEFPSATPLASLLPTHERTRQVFSPSTVFREVAPAMPPLFAHVGLK